MTQRTLIPNAPSVWSTSFPGVVLPTCGDWAAALHIHHETGRMLRVGGEVNLCFECGPDGGVYHPDYADMETVRELAAKLDDRFNRFEVHSHSSPTNTSTIEHSHTDGSEPHKHSEYGPATFDSGKEEHRAYFLMGGGKGPKMGKKPTGPQLEYVELTEQERTFLVVLTYSYDGAALAGKWEGRNNALYTRAEWRRSMDLYVTAARNPGFDPVGHGAITMTAARLMLRFRIEPIYVIQGWKPTPRRPLP